VRSCSCPAGGASSVAQVPRATGIGAQAGATGGRSAAQPAGDPGKAGISGGISATVTGPRTELGEFAPNALTGWAGLSTVLARRLPRELVHSSNMVAAARRRLARLH
jgi:uncharacterized cupredoxin-like copper-binding protein